MPLFLVLRSSPVKSGPLLFADPAGIGIAPVLTALLPQLGSVQTAVFPLPDETTRRFLPSPRLTRSRHADLWFALSASERARALLLAGPTAAYLVPVAGNTAGVVVSVRDPRAAVSPPRGAWRSLLGAFPSLDGIPEEPPDDVERSHWRQRIAAETAGFDLIQAHDLSALARDVAARLGMRPKAVLRAGHVAASVKASSRLRDRPAHWVDEVLYDLSRAPTPRLPSKRRSPD